jgi:subtilase family serine protease
LFAKTGVVASKAWHVDFTILSTTGQLLFHGLYTGIEHPDKYFFRNRQREVGNLYKADGGAVNGVNVGATLNPQPDEVLKILYAKEESRKVVASGAIAAAIQKVLDWPVAEIADASETDYSDLTAFITQLNQWEPRECTYLDTILDVESYLDWLAVNTLVQSNDTYHKNYYLHHRQEDNRWEIMPWDYDLSWGRNWNDYCGGLCDDLSEGTSIKGSNQMANQLSRRVLGSEALFQRLRTKLLALLETEFTQTSLYNKIDALYAQIASLAHQDSGKWPTDIQFEQERDRLKDWIRRRREFLFKELAQTPPPGPEKADTIVTKLETNPPAPVAGQAVTFIATVQNIGSAATGGAVGVAFQLNQQYLTYGLGGTLAAGATMTLTAVSTWTAVAGQYTLRAVVDDINRYPELSEANNILDIPFTVTAKPAPVLSDVTVLDIAFERLTAEQVRLAALVSNIGAAKTPDVVGVAFLVDDKFATYGTIDPLEPGESKAIRAVAPLNLTGQHRITAIADDINRFPEANESNNQLVEIIDFGTPAPKLADTIILSVSLGAAGRFTEGESIYFEAQVKNIGTAITGNTVGVAFTLNGQYLTFGTTSPIEAEETRAIRAVSPWRAVAGQHRLVAVVDDVNRYPELSEANNRFELSFEVLKAPQLLPDSTVDDLGFEINAAKQVILTATVSNIGTAGTPDVVGVAFFVDGVYRTYGIGPRMAIGSQATIKAVAALSLTGKHKVAAVVDDVNRYEELSHQNNRLERELNFVTTVERRAVWVTRYDWTRLGKTPAPDAIDQMVQKVAAAGFNTIFFQVRGAGDSYYTPGLEPWAARGTGPAWATLGQDPGWDPLDRLLTKAHAAGIEVHAYINVYSVWISPPDSSYGQLAPPASNPPHLFDLLTYGPGYAGHPGQYALGTAWRQHDESAKPMPLQWNQILWPAQC